MDTSKIGGWLQIFGNIGLIAGLFLVGIQINQNTEIARADLVSRAYEHALPYHLSMMGENPASSLAKAATNPSELSDEDFIVLQGLVGFWEDFDSRIELAVRLGFSDSDAAIPYWKSRVEFPYGANLATAAIWEGRRTALMPQWQWARTVDKEFRQIEPGTQQAQLEGLRDRIETLTD